MKRLSESQLISKYNVPGPRYTSYPTVPYWDEQTFSPALWTQSIKKRIKNDRSALTQRTALSLYIHLPFCESMCTFCGCTKRITKNHLVEIPYVNALIKEFRIYQSILGHRPLIKQLHFGGGTPTFFSPENLQMLLDGIFNIADKASEIEFSFEGHPNNTTTNHLNVLKNNGFNRVCYGVQDYNDTVQRAINRIQPFKKVQKATV